MENREKSSEKEKCCWPETQTSSGFWRRRRDSNPRVPSRTTRFRVGAVITTSILLHAVYLFISPQRKERTDGENLSYSFVKETRKPACNQGFPWKSSESPTRFRVGAVITTSILLHAVYLFISPQRKERTDGENLSYSFVKETRKPACNQGFPWKSSESPTRFRVGPVMTTSILLPAISATSAPRRKERTDGENKTDSDTYLTRKPA